MTATRDGGSRAGRRGRAAGAVVAFAVSAAALVGFGPGGPTPVAEAADGRQPITIAVVTHGDGGSYWSVARRGARDAGRDLGIRVRYSESNNDPERQSNLIDAAVRAHVDGLAVSAPNPDAIAPRCIGPSTPAFRSSPWIRGSITSRSSARSPM